MLACLALAATTCPPAVAADGRDKLAQAIATTRGSYLVYNFGGGFGAPMLNAAGNWYEGTGGGRLMVVKAASQRIAPRLLVDTHQGFQARCERTPGARTAEGLMQASETYTPLHAWQALGQPTVAINANFFDVRSQQAGSWKNTGCSSPLGTYIDATGSLARANVAVTGTLAYAGKQALSGGDEVWTALSTLILPVRGAPYVVTPRTPTDYDVASPVIERLVDSGARFVAVSGLKLLAPGDTGQLNDPGPQCGQDSGGLLPAVRRHVRLPGRQLHPRPITGSVPRTRQRYRGHARRRWILIDRAAPRHRWNVGRRGLATRVLRHRRGAVRCQGTRATELAGLQLKVRVTASV